MFSVVAIRVAKGVVILPVDVVVGKVVADAEVCDVVVVVVVVVEVDIFIGVVIFKVDTVAVVVDGRVDECVVVIRVVVFSELVTIQKPQNLLQ